MNYTIYLTDNCNMNCKYCYEKGTHKNNQIDIQMVKSLIDIEVKSDDKFCVITFFGGEPLLKKSLIYEISDYIKSKKSKTTFLYNMTTNATLIDDDFIEFVKNNQFISISISIDGSSEVHNRNRLYGDQKGSYDIVQKNVKKLLEVSREPVAVPVVTRNNEKDLYSSVESLLNLGFKKISLQYDFTNDWNDQDLVILKEEFEKISKLYMEKMRLEQEFDILEIDEKIFSYIDDKKDVNDNCSVGLRGANLGTDGKLYPCMQFMYDKQYEIGDCYNGINPERQLEVHNNLKQELDDCKDCTYRKRCNHTCSCINKSFSGDPTKTSPFTCEIQRIIIEVADNIAEQMYKENNPIFMQKYYNSAYSSIEKKLLEGGTQSGT